MNQIIYRQILELLMEMLRQNSSTLGLMVPGCPEQLAIQNWLGISANGQPFCRAAVLRRTNNFHSQLEFGRAVQKALDATCYANCTNRLLLVAVEEYPDDYIVLSLVVVT